MTAALLSSCDSCPGIHQGMTLRRAAAAACAGSTLVAFVTLLHFPCQAAALHAYVTCRATQATEQLPLQLRTELRGRRAKHALRAHSHQQGAGQTN